VTNVVCYVEIPASDPAAAAEFYARVFGWEVSASDLSSEAYWSFTTGKDQLTGGFTSEREARDGGVLLYVAVEEISATLEALELAGGRPLEPKAAVGGGHGFAAVFEDPSGNRVGLWSTH
jgi:predicted enzyme related to lactoylglutathione lyase